MKPGMGTTFHVFLPVLDAECEGPEKIHASLPKGDACLMLVDDEAFILDIHKELLEKLGYNVETRASSIDALQAVSARPDKYDLIITDLMMPHMPGDVFVSEVKRLKPECPVILCTGYSDRIDRQMFKKYGITDFLMKPVLLQELAIAVRKALDAAS